MRTLFPYTTLFRSCVVCAVRVVHVPPGAPVDGVHSRGDLRRAGVWLCAVQGRPACAPAGPHVPVGAAAALRDARVSGRRAKAMARADRRCMAASGIVEWLLPALR